MAKKKAKKKKPQDATMRNIRAATKRIKEHRIELEKLTERIKEMTEELKRIGGSNARDK